MSTRVTRYLTAEESTEGSVTEVDAVTAVPLNAPTDTVFTKVQVEPPFEETYTLKFAPEATFASVQAQFRVVEVPPR